MVRTQFKVISKEKLDITTIRKIENGILQVFVDNGIEFEGLTISEIKHVST